MNIAGGNSEHERKRKNQYPANKRSTGVRGKYMESLINFHFDNSSIYLGGHFNRLMLLRIATPSANRLGSARGAIPETIACRDF